MDDATIMINYRCFKEVIKELTDYEDASGANVNYLWQRVSGLAVRKLKGSIIGE